MLHPSSYSGCAILTVVHHLPEKGTPERKALILEIKADPVAYCNSLMHMMGTEEIDALFASLGKTQGLLEGDS